MMSDVEISVHNLVTVADAVAIIDRAPLVPRVERMALADADGRVLAGAVVADRDYPPFDKALMDGYAVRAGDTVAGDPAAGDATTCHRAGDGGAAEPAVLRRVGEVAAGAATLPAIGPGQCVAIMTGAPLPPGADAVVPVERTAIDGDAVRVATVKTGNAVAPRAVEAAAGRPLLSPGMKLGPAGLAVCAQVGAGVIDVFARPRVGILSTGDEVIPYVDTPTGAQIRGSNSILLTSLVRRYGGEPIDLGHTRDDPAAIAAALSTPGLDALCVTGGMSMGVYDYTPRVMRELGYDLAVTKLKIKPGKPFVMGLGPWALGLGQDGDLATESSAQGPVPKAQGLSPVIFGLPGNPVSAFVCTVRLVSRYLLRFAGASPEPAWAAATLGHAVGANGPREFYLPAVVTNGVVRVPAWNGSADLFALATANALLVRASDAPALDAGAGVTVLPLL